MTIYDSNTKFILQVHYALENKLLSSKISNKLMVTYNVNNVIAIFKQLKQIYEAKIVLNGEVKCTVELPYLNIFFYIFKSCASNSFIYIIIPPISVI